jgi:hypothetical protein
MFARNANACIVSRLQIIIAVFIATESLSHNLAVFSVRQVELKVMHGRKWVVDVVETNTPLQQRKLLLREQVAQLEEPAVLSNESTSLQELDAVSRIRFPVPEKVFDSFQSHNVLILAQQCYICLAMPRR